MPRTDLPERPPAAVLLAVTRYRVEPDRADWFAATARTALAALAERPGHLDGVVARNVDDPGLWTLTTRWRDVGSYRRALSGYEVKVRAVPLLSLALDEPTAYEVVATETPATGAGASG